MIYNFAGKKFELPSTVEQEIDLPTGERLVLLRPQGMPEGPEWMRNVYLLGRDGTIVWKIAPFLDMDCAQIPIWTGIGLDENGQIWAYNILGFEMDIDAKTGQILKAIFTK